MKNRIKATAIASVFALSNCGFVDTSNPAFFWELRVSPAGVSGAVGGQLGAPAPSTQTEQEVSRADTAGGAVISLRALTAEQSAILSEIDKGARRYGVDPLDLAAIGWLESNLRNVKSPLSSARGPMQFIDSSAELYGIQDRDSVPENVDAGARMARDNIAYLRRHLGRAPTGAEIYLAHQQGPAGSLALLTQGAAQARAVLGVQNHKLNTRGAANESAATFVANWTRKFNAARARFTLR